MRITGILLAAAFLWAGPTGTLSAKERRQRPGVPDKELQKKIDKAIEQGAKWIRAHQKASGQLASVKHQSSAHYVIGGTALAGLALLAAGDKQGDPVVDKAMAYCKLKDDAVAGNRTTYDAGTLLMFVTKYYGKFPNPLKKKKKGAKVERNPCQLPEPIREWVRSLANFLVEKQRETGDWGYPAGAPDFSNTQYAMLGLRAAKDCGIPIPPQVFLRVIDRSLDRQQKEGKEVPRLRRDGERVYVIGKDKARGWPYRDPSNAITGSMTTAGIAILYIAHDALLNPRKFPGYPASRQATVAQAAADGFAWLQTKFAVDRNPGAGGWHYYYLYGLERAGAFGGRDLIGERDWYIEGAKYLVSKQHKDGKWSTGELGPSGEFEASDMLDTAWAILFLKRATRPLTPFPVITK